MKHSLAIILTAALLAACSSGSPSLPVTGTSASGQAVQENDAATATFTIQWAAPPKSHRRGDFISPKAQALILEVNPDAVKPGTVAIVNNPDTGHSSTVTVEAPVGVDDFVFSLWDTPQKKHESTPAGVELGQAELPHQKILAQGNNVLHVTIGGIAARLTAVPLSNQPFLETDAQTGGYALVGDASVVFALTAYDAAGAVIVPPGAPQYELSIPVDSRPYLSVSPVKGKPNEFSIRTTSLNQAPNTLAIVPSGIDATGASQIQGLPIPISTRAALYVSYASGRSSKVAVYDDLGNFVALPPKAFAGLKDPVAMIYDAVDQRIFVADDAVNGVLAFDTSGNPIKGFTMPALPGANGVTYDTLTKRVFASGTNSVIEFRPSTGTAIALPKGAFSETARPHAITFIPTVPIYNPGGHGAQNETCVVVANASTFSSDYYEPDGTYLQSKSVSTSIVNVPIGGLLFDMERENPTILIAGGTSGDGFVIQEDQNGNAGFPPVTSTKTSYAGIAVDPTLNGVPQNDLFPGEVFVTEPDANTIQGLGDTLGGISPDSRTIQTPFSTGLAHPQGLTVVY